MNSNISKHTLINTLTDAYVIYELKSRDIITDNTTMRSRKMKLFELMNSNGHETIPRFQYLSPAVNIKQCGTLISEAESDLTADKEKRAEAVLQKRWLCFLSYGAGG